MSKIRMGLIGTGRIGQVHARNIAANPETELARIADPFVDGARRVASRYGGFVTANPLELVDSSDLDAVLVAAPTPQHVGLIEACVEAGLPVLCEKPIDLDMQRVDAIREKVARSGVPVAIGFNQRFDPSFSDVHTRVAQGEIGELEQLTIVSRDPAPPPSDYIAVSGGIFRDMSIHDLDMVRFFLGEIVEVCATGSTLFDQGAAEHGDYDTVAITLKSVSGAIATVINSRHCSYGYDQRMEAFGSHGLLQVGNRSDSLVSRTSAHAVESKGAYIESFLDRYEDAYRMELAEFVRLVAGESSAIPSYEDGRAAQLLAEAARRSAAEGCIVKVSE